LNVFTERFIWILVSLVLGVFMKVCMVGTHGVGKTTLASKMFAHAIDKGINVRLIHEVARDCPFGINQAMTQQSTKWIISNQMSRELFAESRQASLIICDRGSFDASMYARAFFRDIEESTETLIRASLAWASSYDKIYYIKPSARPIIADGVRDTDIDFQRKVDAKFEDAIRLLRIDLPRETIVTMISDDVQRDLKNYFNELFERVEDVRKF
jgi:nicotinamide riboside kinase